MTFTELGNQIKQANYEINNGNFDLAERLAREVLAELGNSGHPELVEGSQHAEQILHCASLLSLANINYKRGNFDNSLERAHRALALAKEYNLNEIKAKAWNTIGNVYYSLGSYDKALEYYTRALAFHQEFGEKSGVAAATGNIGNVYKSLGSYNKALEYYYTALAAHLELREESAVARVTGNVGNVYKSLGSYDKALEYLNSALASYLELGAKSSVALVTENIGSVYYSIGSYDKALEYTNIALATHQELGDKSGVARLTGNIGIVYMELGSYDKALEYYNSALASHLELGAKSSVAVVTGNIGLVYASLGSYDKALEYYNCALTSHQELGEKYGVASVTGNIGNVYAVGKFEGYDPAKAEEFLVKAIELSAEIGNTPHLFTVHKSLADLYENEKRWEDAHLQFKKYIEIEKEVNVEEIKKQEAIREQLKEIELAKAKADAKHQATEQLLHNVLPPSIANKMLDGNKLIAEKLPCVSVLFADIVEFTKLSQRITPEELVEGLDGIFSEFDALAEKHGLEKIKTIGDAYMVVSGAPIQREDHAAAIANFAFEMVEAMKEFRSFSTGEVIQLRIGIHSGEVVAGVIGKKKFAYDLWGDAVNTASRMESHGEPGKIHVSEEFLKKWLMVNGEWLLEEANDSSSMERKEWLMDNGERLLEEANDSSSSTINHSPSTINHSPSTINHSPFTINNLPLTIIPRGEMAIKGKGMMKTYFLERTAIPS